MLFWFCPLKSGFFYIDVSYEKGKEKKENLIKRYIYLINWVKGKCNVLRIEGLSDEDDGDGDGVEDIVQHGDKYCSKVKS